MADITVTDTGHASHLVDELVTMRNNGEMFDYVIKGSKESFSIHSLVLATMSPMFRAMMRSDTTEAANKEATFPMVSDDIMAKVIDYAYTGTCTFTRAQLTDLIKAAHYFQMPKLLKLCEEQIITVLQPNNCFFWFNLADQLQLTTTLPKIQKMLRTAYRDIITTEEFKLLEMPEVVQYLEDVSEHGTCSDDLLHGVLEWITHDKQNRSKNTQELFTLISIGKCSEDSILKMISKHTDLLDVQMDVYKLMLLDVLNSGKDKAVIILGGQTYHCTNTKSWILQGEQFEKYFETDFQFDQHYYSLCQIPGGIMLTGGDREGERSDMCYICVLSMKMWVMQQPMLCKRSNHGSGYISGKVFVISGIVAFRHTSSVHFMDFEQKIWHKGPPLLKPVNLPKVVTCKSTMFVLSRDDCDLFQLDSGKMSWLRKASLPQSSSGCSVASSKEIFFAAGGDNNINYMYTPETDEWCRLTGPSLVERQGALICFKKKLYLFGGCRRNAQLTDVEEYDISSDKWSLAKWKLPTPLYGFSAFLMDRPTSQ